MCYRYFTSHKSSTQAWPAQADFWLILSDFSFAVPGKPTSQTDPGPLVRLPPKQHGHALIGCLRLTKGRGRAPWRKARRGLGRPPKDLRQAAHPLVLDCALYERECNRPHVRSNAFTSPASPHPHGITSSAIGSPCSCCQGGHVCITDDSPWFQSIHHRLITQ